MDIFEPNFGNRQPLDAYGDGGFRMGGAFLNGSLLILPDRILTLEAATLDTVGIDDLAPLWAQRDQLDFVLVGCGAQIQALPKEFRARFEAHNLPIDFMDTGAACRTFNVLLGEGRNFGALLIAVT